ncbi:uncharacterized protein ARMOST_22483 [Armillaria ostoyae]|uniref:DUF6535 domain-containing protein n=1 Tax=Armillaria ostoyae TaxID=47428 RepID=A0A284SD04_ARMOS|nr:uncharacterized protein ARMOST_22483 [Armillaria ostoyae]
MDVDIPSEILDESSDSSGGASLWRSVESDHTQDLAIHRATTRNTWNSTSSGEVPVHPIKKKKCPWIFGLPTQPAGVYVGVTGDARAYEPSQPFEEGGPTSNIWQAYLDEGLIYDNDMLGNQRGQVNILLVFARLFSAIVSAFIDQSAGNLQPNYQQLSAFLLFDQINIQCALANGTSLDHITTSGIDPTARFTPKHLDSWINGLWFASLSLSLATALFAVLADEWYCYYLSPVARDPQTRSRI